MVECDDEDWDNNVEGDGGGWDDWSDNEVDVAGFNEPELERQGSSFNNALEIYSTKGRTDVKFVCEADIRPILA